MRTTHGAERHTTARFGLAFALLAALLAGMFGPGAAQAQVPVNSNRPYTQNFDTLPTGGSSAWANDVTLKGWYAADDSNAVTTITTYDNAAPGPNRGLYNFGPTNGTDRALGLVGGSNLNLLAIGVLLQNTSGVTITQMRIGYTGEQWLAGATISQSLDFRYKVGATISITDTGFVNDSTTRPFNFPAKVATTSGDPSVGTPLDGNANSTVIGPQTLTFATPLAPNQYVMFRWQANPSVITGQDNGLAVDDLTITPVINNPAPPVPNCPPSLTTPEAVAASAPVSATDPNEVVTNAVITGGAVAGITLTPTSASTGAGVPYTATLSVASTVPNGVYDVAIMFSNASNETATCTVAVTVGPNANFATSKKTVSSTSVYVGQEFTYTLTLTNSGSTAGNFTLNDQLPGTLQVVRKSPGLTQTTTSSGQQLTATGTVNVGQQVVYTVTVKSTATGSVDNSATVTSNSVTKTLVAPRVTVRAQPTPADFSKSTKLVNKTEANPGDQLTYTITVSNSGETAGNFSLSDTLDSNLTLVSAPGMTVNGQTLTASGTVAAGASQKYTIVVRINANTPSNTIISNNATLTGGGTTKALTASTVTVLINPDRFNVYLPMIGKSS